MHVQQYIKIWCQYIHPALSTSASVLIPKIKYISTMKSGKWLEAQRELFNFEALTATAVFPLFLFIKLDRTADPAQCNAVQTTSFRAPVSTRLTTFNFTANDKLSLCTFFHVRVSRWRKKLFTTAKQNSNNTVTSVRLDFYAAGK